MSYQRRVLYFSVFLVLVLSSCIPSGASPDTPDQGDDLLVSGKCIKEGSQIYISRDGNYCFAYPYGLYIENKPEENSITLKASQCLEDIESVVESLMNPDGDETQVEEISSEDLSFATLNIFYAQHEDYTLDKFINRRLSDEPIYKLDFHLEDEEAYMLSTDSGDESASLLHIFTSHNDIYYHIAFVPSFGSINKKGEKYLMELFIAITETFTFLK